MKTSVSFGAVILASLLAQQGSPQIDKSAPAPAVTVVNYRTTYVLGCGISLIPIPETLVQNPYVQSLGDQVQSHLSSATCTATDRAMIFIIQSRENLDIKIRILNQGPELHQITSIPLNRTVGVRNTVSSTDQTAEKILSQLSWQH